MSHRQVPSESRNPHEGHRERLREKFLKNGMDALNSHEILEFLLFYVHPRANTNEIAHELIHRFGSVKGVLDADYEELLQVPGVGHRAATLLTFLPRLLSVYTADGLPECLADTQQRCRFFQSRLLFETSEVVLLACLNDKLEVLRCAVVGRGAPEHVQIDHQALMRAILFTRCTCAVLGHNHPMGVAVPSFEDVRVTEEIRNFLKTAGVTLYDHIIAAGGKVISMRETGSFQPD